MQITQCLPPATFVPFQARRLANPQMLWTNSTLPQTVDLAGHAYCVPLADEPEDAYQEASSIYWAERYGGDGLAGNGGGARCGLSGDVQIKGIGPTPVAGAKTEFWYAHGAASLEEGIREALWGEVCQIALPHGSARIHGLVATDTECLYNAHCGAQTARRTLIVRTPSVRPAHFMRAIYFWPHPAHFAEQPSDTERTRLAIQSMDGTFSRLFDLGDESPIVRINHGLLEMVRRFARQIGAARAKRIMHGALNCSNICVDGSWLDYGTISTVSDHGRIIVAAHNPDQWTQHSPLIRTCSELHFYLGKFLPKMMSMQLVELRVLLETFDRALAESLAREYVKLLGVPDGKIDHIDKALLERMYRCLHAIVACGNGEPFKLAPQHVPDMPDRMGAYSLSEIIRTACWCRDVGNMQTRLRPLLQDDVLRAAFCENFDLLRTHVINMYALAERPYARLFMTLDAMRLNTRFEELYRPELDRSIQEVIRGERPLGDHLDSIIKKARRILSDASGKLPSERFTSIYGERHEAVSAAEGHGQSDRWRVLLQELSTDASATEEWEHYA